MTEHEDRIGAAPPEDGDWEAEYAAFERACALVDRADRAIVRVSGERHRQMLNGILSQEIESLTEAGRPALLLNTKGRVLADLRVLPFGDASWVDVPRAGLDNVVGAFRKYLPPMFAPWEDLSGGIAILGVYGPRAASVVSAALTVEPPAEHLAVEEVERDGLVIRMVRNRRLAGDGVEILIETGRVAEFRDAIAREAESAGGRRAGRRAFEAVRIEFGVPFYGSDITEANLAQETGLHEAISFDKGCYLGQEVVARIHFRGHVNRHLRGLRFKDALPASGAHLFHDDRDVGHVTSAALSPSLGPVGLGYVRREIEPPATLRWRAAEGGDGVVQVLELPLRKAFEVAKGQP